MNPDQLFSIANTYALIGWLLLFFAPRWKWTSRIIYGAIITVVSAAYVFLLLTITSNFNFSDFASLSGVVDLFKSPRAVLVGWLHYIAFDIFVGHWVCMNAQKHGIHHLLVVPCIFFCLMLGPTGLLMYLLLRWGWTKRFFADEQAQ